MRKVSLLSTLVFILLMGSTSFAQDFSNKGKDFWVGYGYHERMSANSQDMVLYFATDAVTTVTVSIPALGYNMVYPNIPANTVFTSLPLPKSGAQDSRLITESVFPENKGIHITADRPIVAYAHIYNQSVSGATILFPTNTLGQEYYSINYKNISNSSNANCWFYVVACDTGVTKVEITPSAATLTHAAGVPFTVSMTQGQVYNVMGQFDNAASPLSGVDLTGSKVQSLSSGNGCKRIGVFSGSGRISITCTGASSSSDNYMVQAFPKTAWGKKYLTSSTGGVMTNNIYRVCVSDPATTVLLNGLPIGLPLQNNFYYEIPSSNSPKLIEGDKPILVAQYVTSGGACGNGGTPGDPEVIYLSPVEQNINRVLWNATPNWLIAQHYFNVIIPNTGTGISSFKLDGAAVPPASFIVHPQSPGYSYLTQSVLAGQHIITSDSGFNAIAYGFGSAESYGYNAGTNVKDLYQFISIKNPQATVNFPAACKNTPFYFAQTFPYQPTQIEWDFSGLFPPVLDPSPVFDSTWFVNGKQLFMYKLASSYTISVAGTYPIKITAQNPTPDGCSGEQEIFFDLLVSEKPTSDFTINASGCGSPTVSFTDNSNGGGRTTINWSWLFGDGGTSSATSPSHTYPGTGSFDVKHTIYNDIGCVSDTVMHTVVIGATPTANFSAATPYCAGKPISFTDNSTNPGGPLAKWYWDFGDGSPQVIATTNAVQIHAYAAPGLYNATLKVETPSGCQSTVFSLAVNVRATPLASFIMPTVCLPAASGQFNDQSTISDGTQALFTYAWSFGDGGTANIKNPVHIYASAGPFNVSLVVTSNNGCVDDSIQALTTIYAQPKAIFSQDSLESCIGGTVNFTDQSTAAGSTVTQWFWDFGDATTSNAQHPNHTYAAPGIYPVKLYINSAIGCRSDTMTKNITVLALPTSSFTNSAPVCEASNVTFTSTSVPNAGVITQYAWTVNAVSQGGNSPNFIYNPTGPGGYTIGLTVTTDKGCSKQSSSVVSVRPRPVASFNLPSICLPSGSANFTSSSTISDGSQALFTYGWNFGDGGTSILQNPSHVYAGVGPYNVTLTVTSNNGCADDSVRVLNTISPEPQAAFNAPAEVCLNSPASFSDVSTAGGSSVTQWNWDFGDGSTSTQQNPIKTYASTGNYTIRLNVTSAVGCPTVTNFATKTLLVNPLPTSNFNLVIPSCEKSTTSFTDASVANAGNIIKWTWTYGDGNNAVLMSGPFTHNYAAVGTYNVSLNVETDKGCVSTITTKPVTINSKPKAGFVSSQGCLFDPSTFTDASTVTGGTITGWNWNFGDGGLSPQQNPSHPYAAAGNYNATLIAISNNGCQDTITKAVFVNGGAPVADFTLQNASLCSNKNVVLVDASSVDFGNLTKLEIYWDFGNDPTIKTVDNSPQTGRTYSHTYPEFGSPASQNYTVRYVAYSGTNCVNTMNRTVTLLATPVLQFSPVIPVCSNATPFQISGAQLLNVLPGAGVFSGTGVDANGLFTPSVSGAGSFTIRYTYTGNNTCLNYIEQNVVINPMPGANAGPDKVVIEGGTVTLTPATNASMPVNYQWTPITGLNNPAQPFVVVSSVTGDITYTLTVTSDKGCVSSDQVTVKYLKNPVVPNIFSPNGDGTHDKWDIDFLASYPGCTVDIYNRYGQLIFKSIGYSTPWDGTINGKPAAIGTYYYIINPKNQAKVMTGYVDIIR